MCSFFTILFSWHHTETVLYLRITPLNIYFFDGWRVHPTLPIPGHLPRTKEAPVQDIAPTAPAPGTEPTRSPEEEARDILATAAKNHGPNTRRAAVRACKCSWAMVNQYESTIQEVDKAARIHTQKSKGTAGATADCRPQGEALPVISPEPRCPTHGLWLRSRSISSEFPNCADSTLLTNMPGEQSDCPRPHMCQTLRQRSRRSSPPKA